MKSKNYFKIFDNKLNAIYCRDKDDIKLFHDGFSKIKTLISMDTGHPLGN